MQFQIRNLPRWLQRIFIKRILVKHGCLFVPYGQRFGDGRIVEHAITCLTCGRTSYSVMDAINKFCVLCGYHDENARRLYVEKKNPYAA